MNEQQPLGDVNLEKLFAAIDGKIAAGGNIGDLLGVSRDPQETGRAADERLVVQRLGLLDKAFSNDYMRLTLHLDIRHAGEAFKDSFEKWKNARVNNPSVRMEDRDLANLTTLQNLAEAAEHEHERFVRLLGAAVPDSQEAQELGVNTFRWGKIPTIVREASEIKD